ncbi:MAG TPA: SUF system Fe-S cluster assembly regulator, partial [Gammaproteobacteria bacterium]|nr:SUF system Fe-S cluster assembly regulator [Gammaproteobacteria bacterium]
MLRISKLADYATLIMSHLAEDAMTLCSASVLAKSLGLSLAVVSKILKILCQAGLVQSVRGVEGGYRLARPAQKITLASVVAAIEGKLAVTECCGQASVCILDSTCTTKRQWKN